MNISANFEGRRANHLSMIFLDDNYSHLHCKDLPGDRIDRTLAPHEGYTSPCVATLLFRYHEPFLLEEEESRGYSNSCQPPGHGSDMLTLEPSDVQFVLARLGQTVAGGDGGRAIRIASAPWRKMKEIGLDD